MEILSRKVSTLNGREGQLIQASRRLGAASEKLGKTLRRIDEIERLRDGIKGEIEWCQQQRNARDVTTLGMVQARLRNLLTHNAPAHGQTSAQRESVRVEPVVGRGGGEKNG